MKLEAPVVLFCSERSGSNLVTTIFDSHPLFCGPGPSHLYRIMAQVAVSYEEGSDALRRAVVRLFRAKLSSWKIDTYSDDELFKLLSDSQQAAEMVTALYRAEMEEQRKRHLFLKEVTADQCAVMIASQSQNPRYLHMVRDPRDMAASWIQSPLHRGGTLRAARTWISDQMRFLRAVSQFETSTPISSLRYEDLVSSPGESLERVCRDLSIAFDPRMLNHERESSRAATKDKNVITWKNLQSPISASSVGKFRAQLTTDQITYIEHLAQPLMSLFGYERIRMEELSPTSLSALEQRLSAIEPFNKASFDQLPEKLRIGAQKWSQLTRDMLDLPPVALSMRCLAQYEAQGET